MNINTIYEYFLNSSGVCTDTRKITKNCLFFALRGDHFNGNTFAKEALKKGAYKVVIDDPKFHNTSNNTILCKDSLALLQELATYHRVQLGLPIIALTGSNGKTTTKELIAAVLSKNFNCLATKGNLNNHIGVPLTLLSINKTTDIAVVEMGANHLNEIKVLSEIAQPDFGYITNFGKAHLEGFGSEEGIIKGKSELYQYLIKYHKKVFVNGDDTKQMELTKHIERYIFGSKEQDAKIELLDADEKLIVKFKNTLIKSQLIGLYNFYNIAAAIAIGDYFKIPLSKIKQAIEGYIPEMNRSQLISENGVDIILDAYNANPSSMLAALENFIKINRDEKIIILGDMFELGEYTNKEHQNIVDFLEKHSFEKAFLVGEHFYEVKISMKNIYLFKTYKELKNYIISHPIKKASLLIKGSRGMQLERVLDIL